MNYKFMHALCNVIYNLLPYAGQSHRPGIENLASSSRLDIVGVRRVIWDSGPNKGPARLRLAQVAGEAQSRSSGAATSSLPMSSSTAYEPLPRDESTSPPPVATKPPAGRLHRLFHSRALIIVFALFFVSFTSFQAGKWSVQRDTPDLPAASDHTDEKPPSLAQTPTIPAGAVPTVTPEGDTANMTHGKYNVG
jgi:hypothetical protein